MKSNETTKYFLYARKSSEEKSKQITSINDQIKTMKDIALKENIRIVKVYSESKSAFHPGRTVFNEMLQEIEKGKQSKISFVSRVLREGKILYVK